MCTKFIIVFCLLLTLVNCCPAQWKWLNPQPSGFSNMNTAFTSTTQGFILNNNGDLLSTDNQGNSWQAARHFAGMFVMDIKDSTGVVAGNSNTIYISKDGGISWEAKPTNLGENYFSFLAIVSRDTFFLASPNGHIFRTDNRGESWTALDCGNPLSAIFFVNSKTGFAGCTATTLLKTEDGGLTWKVPSSDRTVPAHTRIIFFLDLQTGFVSDDGDLKKTTDGGKTWGNDFGNSTIYHSLYFTTKDTGYAAGEGNAFLRTTDGGTNWTPLDLPGTSYDYDLNSVYFISNTTGFTAGLRGRILKTTDGGDTWQSYLPEYTDISSLSLPALNTSYAVARNAVYKTTDSGKNWLPLPIQADSNFYYGAIFQQSHFATADTGFVTTSAPVRVYKTNNGGNSWLVYKFMDHFQNTYDHADSKFFINNTTGFINVEDAYEKSHIFKTTDCGSTWSEMGDASNLYLQQLFFLNEKTGYATNYGTLYKTDDSAKTWKQLYYTNYGVAINSIHFVNEKTGYIAGDLSLLQVTNDSGKTWTSTEINTLPSNYLAIHFYDEKIGYLTDNLGKVFRTADGGLSWQNDAPLPFGCNIITYSADSSVYVAGMYGAIVKTSLSKYAIDSVQVANIGSCNVSFAASVTTVLSRADSLQFEYGVDDYTNSVYTIPDSIINEQKTIAGTATGLQPGTTYKLRVKLWYKGSYQYSDDILFTTAPAPAAPLITVNGTSSVCAGDSVVLHSSAIQGNRWLLNGTPISGADSSIYVAHTSGSYTVADSAACTSAISAAVVITINPVPAVPTIMAAGSVLTSSAGTGNQWYRNDTLITGATAQQYNVTTAGNYTVRVTVNGCTSALSPSYLFSIAAIGNGFFNGEVQYGPNPVSSRLLIQNKNSRNLSVGLFTTRGVKIKELQLSGANGAINIQDLPKGMYVLQVTDITTGEHQSKLVAKE